MLIKYWEKKGEQYIMKYKKELDVINMHASNETIYSCLTISRPVVILSIRAIPSKCKSQQWFEEWLDSVKTKIDQENSKLVVRYSKAEPGYITEFESSYI